MKKFTLCLKVSAYVLVCVIFFAFSADPFEQDVADVQQKLTDHYDFTPDLLKKYELNVTKTGFCRYKCFFNSGKVEYFSFNLMKFKDLDFLGTTQKGTLLLHTKGDDVIVQTYNSKNGDIDSMATYMSIPLKNMEAEDLNEISAKLQKMSRALHQ